VKFHHGRELTSDDVVYSFTRLIDPQTKSTAAELFANVRGARDFRNGQTKQVAGLRAVDRYTVEVILDEVSLPFVSVLAVGPTKIVPREVAERLGENFGLSPVGTGPFRFAKWERGREIVLSSNPEYFGGPPKLSRVVFRVFPGAPFDAIYEEFQKGHLEDSPLPSRDYRRVVRSGGHLYVKRLMFSHRHYGLNTRVKPLDDRRVRQALIYAIDRQALVDEVFLGRHTVARGILPPGTLGFNPDVKSYPYDPDRARELLAQAGYPGGHGLGTLPVWSSVKHEGILREHEQIRRQLEEVGVRADFHYLPEWPVFFRMLGERRFPVFLHAWFADVPDPDNFLFKLFHSRSPRNFFGYANRRVDELLLRAQKEQEIARRVELYRRAEQLIMDDAPIIPIFHYTYERLFQPYVRSIEVNGLGDPYIPLRKIWLDRRG
jgi:peptide/nickel transport system substrate-binding protein/oligopeptide transport system substrate-binding protein